MITAHMAFGDQLRKLRTSRGLSLRGLAQKANVGYVSVFRIEAGKQDPTLSMLKKLAKAFEITVSKLIGERAGSNGPERRKNGASRRKG